MEMSHLITKLMIRSLLIKNINLIIQSESCLITVSVLQMELTHLIIILHLIKLPMDKRKRSKRRIKAIKDKDFNLIKYFLFSLTQ